MKNLLHRNKEFKKNLDKEITNLNSFIKNLEPVEEQNQELQKALEEAKQKLKNHQKAKDELTDVAQFLKAHQLESQEDDKDMAWDIALPVQRHPKTFTR